MTEIRFHFNVPDRSDYVCRLLRKAMRQGAQVAVTAPAATLAALDRELWTFDAVEFIPHLRLTDEAPPAQQLQATPICLLEDLSHTPHHEVLLNLGPAAPVGFESFARVIEIVSIDEADRQAGRERWKHYAHRGYAIQRHEAPNGQ